MRKKLNYASYLGGQGTEMFIIDLKSDVYFLCDVRRLHSSLCGANQQKSLDLWPFLPPSRCHKLCRSPSYQLWVVISFEVWKKLSSDSYTRHYIIDIVQLHVSSSKFLYLLLAAFFSFSLELFETFVGFVRKHKTFLLFFFPVLASDENWIIILNICWRRKGVWHVCFPRNLH